MFALPHALSDLPLISPERAGGGACLAEIASLLTLLQREGDRSGRNLTKGLGLAHRLDHDEFFKLALF